MRNARYPESGICGKQTPFAALLLDPLMHAPLWLPLLALVAATGTAFAQAKKAAAPSGPETRYFTYFDEFLDGQADVILKQVRNGAAITSAVLDICYPSPKGSDRRDRFTTDLKVSGNSMTAATATQLDKSPVDIALTQTRAPGANAGFNITGSIKIGNRTLTVNSKETSDTSEKDFEDSKSKDDDISPAPAAFVEVSPESIAARVKLDAVTDFVKSLRGTNVYVSKTSLIASCENLRAGTQTIRMSVNPETASATINQLKGRAGVTAIGWSYGDLELARAIRFPAKDWSSEGKIDSGKIGTALTDTLKKAFNADSAISERDEISGKYTIKLKRPSAALASLGLSETLEVTAMAAFDKPGISDAILLWIGYPTGETVDEQTGARLLLTETAEDDAEDQTVDDGGAIDELAKYFKAQKWDEETSKFK